MKKRRTWDFEPFTDEIEKWLISSVLQSDETHVINGDLPLCMDCKAELKIDQLVVVVRKTEDGRLQAVFCSVECHDSDQAKFRRRQKAR